VSTDEQRGHWPGQARESARRTVSRHWGQSNSRARVLSGWSNHKGPQAVSVWRPPVVPCGATKRSARSQWSLTPLPSDTTPSGRGRQATNRWRRRVLPVSLRVSPAQRDAAGANHAATCLGRQGTGAVAAVLGAFQNSLTGRTRICASLALVPARYRAPLVRLAATVPRAPGPSAVKRKACACTAISFTATAPSTPRAPADKGPGARSARCVA